MATIHEESRTQQSKPAAEAVFEDRSGRDSSPRPLSRGGRGGKLAVLFVLLGGLAVAGYFAWPQISGAFGGSEDRVTAALHTVQRGDLRVTISDDGDVESASNVDVKCQVAGGSTILWIVEDGTIVEAGDEIVRLDQATLEDQFNTQKGVYETAVAAHIQARETFGAAQIAVQEYIEGTFQKELQTYESQITVAEQNLRSAQDLLEHTERMVRKNFATPLQLEADQFAVKRAELDLETAKLAKATLVDFTKLKMVKELEAARDAAEATLRSAEANLALEKAKLDRLEEQLKNCIITAPQGGMVVYANERSRRSESAAVEEGAAVRDRQTILRIPDLTNMQVKVTVHESRIDQIRIGMPAEVRIGDRDVMRGEVITIANQPESTNWFSANVKEYATTVKIDGQMQGLKPGMTAVVDIEIADLQDVLVVPVSVVVEQRGKFYAWVHTPEGPKRRELLLGLTNDKLIEIRDGLAEGEQVYLNPRAAVEEASEDQQPREARSPGAEQTPAGEESPDAAGAAGAGPTAGGPGAGGPGASSGAPGAGPAAGPGEAGPGGPGPGGRPQFSFSESDADGDGKLSSDEAPEWMQNAFDRIDANSDGFVDQAELAEMRSRMRAAGGGRGPGGPGGPGGGARP